MGKLDYLAKYASSSSGKKSKKKKNKKKKKQYNEMLFQGEDEDKILSFPSYNDDCNDDEDRPVVVPLEEPGVFSEKKIIKQEWTEITDNAGATEKQKSSRQRNDDDSSVDQAPIHRRRHDSDDDSDGSSSDHISNRRRHDSDEGSLGNQRGQENSDSDSVTLNHSRHHVKRIRRRKGGDGKLKRRQQRHDSDSDESYHAEKGPRKRHDSDDDISSAEETHERHSRKKYDSESDHSVSQPRNSRKRRDFDDEYSGEVKNTGKWKDQGNTTVSNEKRKRSRNDKELDMSEKPSRNSIQLPAKLKIDPAFSETVHERMSSGHVAGLQQARDFKGAEKQIQERKSKEAQDMVNKYGMGETIYRDEMGRKIEIKKGKVPKMNHAEQEALNKGRIQKEQEMLLKKEWKSIQDSAFARHVDDSNLEEARKNLIREGDPMAKYTSKKKEVRTISNTKTERPIYKGPNPKPNRFGIRPGYRWDGVDRGNNFEDKVLQRKYSADHKKEAAYRWSTSDM